MIPRTIGKLSHLSKFYMPQQISMPFLTSMHFQPGTLDLSHSALNGHLPSEIGMCTGLEALYLHKNGLSGILPNELQYLVMLNQVQFDDNKYLMGDLSDEIVFLSNLKYLNIRSTGISINC
jgi:hypothetical protein